MDKTKVLLGSRLNFGFNLNYFSFYCKFHAFKIILFCNTCFYSYFIGE